MEARFVDHHEIAQWLAADLTPLFVSARAHAAVWRCRPDEAAQSGPGDAGLPHRMVVSALATDAWARACGWAWVCAQNQPSASSFSHQGRPSIRVLIAADERSQVPPDIPGWIDEGQAAEMELWLWADPPDPESAPLAPLALPAERWPAHAIGSQLRAGLPALPASYAQMSTVLSAHFPQLVGADAEQFTFTGVDADSAERCRLLAMAQITAAGRPVLGSLPRSWSELAAVTQADGDEQAPTLGAVVQANPQADAWQAVLRMQVPVVLGGACRSDILQRLLQIPGVIVVLAPHPAIAAQAWATAMVVQQPLLIVTETSGAFSDAVSQQTDPGEVPATTSIAALGEPLVIHPAPDHSARTAADEPVGTLLCTGHTEAQAVQLQAALAVRGEQWQVAYALWLSPWPLVQPQARVIAVDYRGHLALAAAAAGQPLVTVDGAAVLMTESNAETKAHHQQRVDVLLDQLLDQLNELGAFKA